MRTSLNDLKSGTIKYTTTLKGPNAIKFRAKYKVDMNKGFWGLNVHFDPPIPTIDCGIPSYHTFCSMSGNEGKPTLEDIHKVVDEFLKVNGVRLVNVETQMETCGLVDFLDWCRDSYEVAQDDWKVFKLVN